MIVSWSFQLWSLAIHDVYLDRLLYPSTIRPHSRAMQNGGNAWVDVLNQENYCPQRRSGPQNKTGSYDRDWWLLLNIRNSGFIAIARWDLGVSARTPLVWSFQPRPSSSHGAPNQVVFLRSALRPFSWAVKKKNGKSFISLPVFICNFWQQHISNKQTLKPYLSSLIFLIMNFIYASLCINMQLTSPEMRHNII